MCDRGAVVYRAVYEIGSKENVLKRVKKMPVRASIKSFFFQLHSNTLPVKPWLEQKGLFVSWSINCTVCNKPETIEQIFLDCWDAVFLWDILQRTLKKELPVTPYGIRFLPTDTTGFPYDMVMLVCMHSIWKTGMAVQNADLEAHSAREYFIEYAIYFRETYRVQEEPPISMSMLDDLVSLKRF